MNSTKSKTTMVIGTIIVLIAGTLTVMYWKRTRPDPVAERQAAEIAATVSQINRVNIGRPEMQVQAKTLIYATLIQKHIPPASKWCDTLNVGGKLWPATPTNTFFAINSQVAGRAYSRTNPPSGQVVVFFETANPGWNLAGGPDMVADNPEGVAVAFADGRAMIVPQNQVAKLRWTP
jgi:hypothetical protein